MQETYQVETQVELIVENKKLSILKKIGHNPHIFRQWVTKVLKMFEPLFQILYKFEMVERRTESAKIVFVSVGRIRDQTMLATYKAATSFGGGTSEQDVRDHCLTLLCR